MSEKFLRSGISRGLSENGKVDREKNVIFGYAVMTKGFVKDMRGWEIDDDTLDQIVQAGNSLKMGVKARFGHPNMSSTAFGTLLGRSKNFRKEGNIVRADLHLSETAFNTPSGDLGTYVLDMAENEPDMFGSSVVLTDFSFEYRLEKDGTRKKDKQGNDLPPLLRVKKISASDIVDEPAANNGMFAKQFFSESVMPSAEMTEFLDKFLSSEDAVQNVISFLTRYSSNRDHIDGSELGNNKNQSQEDNNMDLKTLTLEKLEAENPELVQQIREAAMASDSEDGQQELNQALSAARNEGFKAGQAEAVAKERERVLGILAFTKQKELSAYTHVAEQCIKDGDSEATSELKIKDARLADLEKNANAPVNPGDGNDLGSQDDPHGIKAQTDYEKHLSRAKAYKKEHNCSITEALKKTASEK